MAALRRDRQGNVIPGPKEELCPCSRGSLEKAPLFLLSLPQAEPLGWVLAARLLFENSFKVTHFQVGAYEWPQFKPLSCLTGSVTRSLDFSAKPFPAQQPEGALTPTLPGPSPFGALRC